MHLAYHKRTLLVASLILFSFSASPAATAHEKSSVWKVPIFYVTDRESKKQSFDGRRLAEDDTVSGMRSGIAEVCVRGNSKLELQDWQKNGISMTECKSIEPVKLKPFKCQTTKDLQGEFNQSLVEAIRKSPRKEAFVFVHGFNTSFENGAKDAAELAFATGSPVILYSWPSTGKLYRYSLDECNNEWSQEHFNEFIENLHAVKESENMQFNIVAHSMGNRLLVRAVPVMRGKAIFSDIFMIYPDFDAQTFVHYLSRYIPEDGLAHCVRGQLLVSRKDKALSAAEGLFGGYTRLGQGADFTLSALTRPDLFSKVWSNNGSNDSGLPTKDTSERVASLQRALSIVDVTSLDYGAIGHKIPHEYVAWMHYRNSAPEGFVIEEGKSRGCNGVSSMLARLCRQKIAPPVGSYAIVTRSPIKHTDRNQRSAISTKDSVSNK